MSCFTIASARGLERIFPEALFVHSVRDGRDSGSSKVSKAQKSHHPSDAASGVEWWEGRLALAERGYRGLEDPSRLHAVCLDELVWGDREASYAGLREFAGLDDDGAMRAFFDNEMNAQNAHRERWREGLDGAQQQAVVVRYERALDRIEREGYHCAALLRTNYERADLMSAPRAAATAGVRSSSSAAPAAAARTSSAASWASTPRIADVPIEARFHCNKRGLPDLLEGRVSLGGFLEKLRDFWWHRIRVDDQPRGPLLPDVPLGLRRRAGALRGVVPLGSDRGRPARSTSTSCGRSPRRRASPAWSR